jgi:hypothetical protein
MTFEADLVAHLVADSGIVAVVSNRIRPIVRKQGESNPCITYHRVAGVPMADLDGLDGKLIDIRLQLDCWAAGFEAAAALGELVRTRLQTSASSFVARVNFDEDLYEDDARIFRRMLDVSFHYRVS